MFIGYSLKALLIMIIASCALITLPIVFSWQKLPDGIVHVGTNSVAISAACHVSPSSGEQDSLSSRPFVLPLARVEALSLSHESVGSGLDDGTEADAPENQETRLMQGVEGIEMESLIGETRLRTEPPMKENAEVSERRDDRFIRVSESELRWGVVKMPPAFYDLFDSDVPYEHLGFGVQEDMVSPPVESKLYA